MSDISKRLTKYRKAAKLSQEEVAEKLSVSRQTVSKWETGQSTPDFDKIAPLCELYNISTDELLRGVVTEKKEEKKEEEPTEGEVVDEDNDDDDDDHCCGKCKKDKSPTAIITGCIFTILALFTLIFYLVISFSTHMWHITWIIWLVYAVIVTVIKLILAIFGIYVDDDYKGHKAEKPKSRGLRIFGLIMGLFFLLVIIGAIGAFFILPGGMFFGIHKGISDEKVLDKTYDVDFKTLNINTKAGKILVKDSVSEKMQVVIFSDDDEGYEVKKDGDEFKIDMENEGCRGLACFKYKMPSIEVYIPKDYADKISIKNNYGDIEIGYFEKAIMDIDESYGRVSVKAASELKLKNSMGSAEIEHISNAIDLDASMGSVSIDELVITKDSKIDASMGSVNIKKTNDIYIDAKADMGSVNISKNNRESKVELKVRCSMGSINID